MMNDLSQVFVKVLALTLSERLNWEKLKKEIAEISGNTAHSGNFRQ